MLYHHFPSRSFALSLCLLGLLLVRPVSAQNIPQPLEYTEVYDFLDELAGEGVISINSAIKPYSRQLIASLLIEAQQHDSLLNRRQREDIAFYLQDYALELDTIPDYRLWGHKNVCQWNHLKKGEQKCDFNLSLVEPSLHIITPKKNFKFMLKPILGMELYASKKGLITKRWYGAELQMDIAHHVSLWGSLRDNSWKGTGLLKDAYFPTETDKMNGARLSQPGYLINMPGVQYKEANYGGDFSDSRGGISAYAWWGSIGVQRERIQWGDAYHASTILSAHNPAVPMLTMQLTPCRWFQFDYMHAWLVSNVLDSLDYYTERDGEGTEKLNYRPRPKYMAANMFTFKPIKQFAFSFGNSIVYAERSPQAAYFIPVAFYKSLDHLLTKGVASENQNSQVFGTITIRPVDHLHLYTSVYVDEFKLARLKKSNPQHNPVSWLVGFNWTGWPVKGLALRGEFMRANIATYTHSIAPLTYASNSYNMGHYMGDNAQSAFVELSYRPVRGLSLKLNYTCDTKYNAFDYIRGNQSDKVSGRDEYGNYGIARIIAQKPFNERIWQNDQVGFLATYELFNNCYARVHVLYNYARAYAPSSERAYGEDRGWKEDGTSLNLAGEALQTYYEQKFAPVYFQGKNLTVMCALSFSF